jgi:hypothetical protein
VSEENNISSFSAADIEKYRKGQLSPMQMHAMEKAAMDDPFLADALEGFQFSQDQKTELEQLRTKLDQRIGQNDSTGKKGVIRMTWLKAAAAIIIIAGLGILAQQFLIKQNDPVVDDLTKKQSPVSLADTAEENITGNKNTASEQPGNNETGKQTPAPGIKTSPDQQISSNTGTAQQTVPPANQATDKNLSAEPSVTGNAENVIRPTADNAVIAKKNTEKEQSDKKSFADSLENITSFKDLAESKQKAENARFYNKKQNEGLFFTNKYNYRVVDAQNNPVPFANITNTKDGVGTYTDIKGNFNLISIDSVLDVQIRSLGYNPLNYKLVPSGAANNIILQEDDKARLDIMANNRKVVSSRAREETSELEEPEAGWGNYNTYVANNLNIPGNIREKNKGSEVELSFSVDKNGQPVNIKITRSSNCIECDTEAIRLLKEGPKWKRKGKRSKTTVSISVDK